MEQTHFWKQFVLDKNHDFQMPIILIMCENGVTSFDTLT